MTVVVALIVALSTLGATFLTNRQSNKRFEKELERAREADKRQRRWEVRGEPLLKLRNELARMANKQDNLVAAASKQHTRLDGSTGEEATKELQVAADDWNAYVTSGDFAQALLTQYDTDLANQVEEIRKDYQRSYFYHLHYQTIDKKELLEAMTVFERNRTKIVEVQELINKRLEEL